MKRNFWSKNFGLFRIGMLACGCLLVFSSTLMLADTGPALNHKLVQTPPICLGVSGNNEVNYVKGMPNTASTGTLGSLVEDLNDGTQYILSNAHVMAPENSAAGNPIQHVGSYDTEFFANLFGIANITDFPPDPVTLTPPYDVASLTASECTTRVDAAIAEIEEGLVSASILDITPFNTVIQGPLLGETVIKSGRTTGLTFGYIDAVNVYIDDLVTCEGGAGYFEDQIEIAPFVPIAPGDGFADHGDSGSLVLQIQRGVTPLEPTIGPVGLLFAGGTETIQGANTAVIWANRMDDVINAFYDDYELRFVPPDECTNQFPSLPYDSMPAGRPAGDRQAAKNRINKMLSEVQGSQKLLPAGKTLPDPKVVEAVSKIKDRYSKLLMGVPNAIGHGVALAENGSGQVVIRLLVSKITDQVKQAAPQKLEGVPVELHVVSNLHAL